jgi:hypothetical protein
VRARPGSLNVFAAVLLSLSVICLLHELPQWVLFLNCFVAAGNAAVAFDRATEVKKP